MSLNALRMILLAIVKHLGRLYGLRLNTKCFLLCAEAVASTPAAHLIHASLVA